jgi:hypothetical protein
VDEPTWLTTTDPVAMLVHLRANGPQPSDRRLRLFLCAGCRFLSQHFEHETLWKVVSAAEEYAEGRDDGTRLDAVMSGPSDVFAAPFDELDEPVRQLAVLLALAAATPPSSGRDTWSALDESRYSILTLSTEEQSAAGAALLREVFGNPFRPVAVDRSWLRWKEGAVARMAWSISDGRRFDELPVLADALEDAGCANADILAHLRSPGPHVLGCWALDALLRKG